MGFPFLSCILLVIVFAVVNQYREEQVLLKPISLPLMARAVRLVEDAHGLGVSRPEGKVGCTAGNSAVLLAISAQEALF